MHAGPTDNADPCQLLKVSKRRNTLIQSHQVSADWTRAVMAQPHIGWKDLSLSASSLHPLSKVLLEVAESQTATTSIENGLASFNSKSQQKQAKDAF